MKKLLFISSILTLGIVTQAHAQPQICPFVDHFAVNAPSGYLITSLNSDGNVHALLSDATHFITYCNDGTSRKNGHAYVTIAINSANMCNLTILDGPFEMNPSVVDIHCSGNLSYAGIDHEYGTYYYTLKFF